MSDGERYEQKWSVCRGGFHTWDRLLGLWCD